MREWKDRERWADPWLLLLPFFVYIVYGGGVAVVWITRGFQHMLDHPVFFGWGLAACAVGAFCHVTIVRACRQTRVINLQKLKDAQKSFRGRLRG